MKLIIFHVLINRFQIFTGITIVHFLTLHGIQSENICKKLWNLWNNRKSLVEESIDYFDPRHKYWLQVL